jgi:hypothetical protein
MNDLFLRMFVLRHFAAGLQLGEHLIHRLAVGHRATPNPRTDIDPRIFFGGFSHKLVLTRALDSFNRGLW